MAHDHYYRDIRLLRMYRSALIRRSTTCVIRPQDRRRGPAEVHRLAMACVQAAGTDKTAWGRLPYDDTEKTAWRTI